MSLLWERVHAHGLTGDRKWPAATEKWRHARRGVHFASPSRLRSQSGPDFRCRRSRLLAPPFTRRRWQLRGAPSPGCPCAGPKFHRSCGSIRRARVPRLALTCSVTPYTLSALNVELVNAPGLCIWRFSDGRRGHDAQSRGLTLALARARPCSVHELKVPAWPRSALEWLLRRCPAGAGLPNPQLLIGAGHATHLPLLSAQRARGGRTVLLMTPSLPLRWYDFCLIPAHDAPPYSDNIIRTRGPLNTIIPGNRQRADRGLILIGGPSRHYDWREDALLGAVREIVAASSINWLISDSPRTPPGTRVGLRALAARNTDYVSWDGTDPDWLPEQLAGAGATWITCDSLSMLYEAITAGGRVGMLELPTLRNSRLTEEVRRLADEHMVTPFAAWRSGTPLQPPAHPLHEAARCAELLLNRLN